MLELERAETAHEALDIAHRLGIPHQNLVVGDAQGNIGWTVTTALPRRFGFDGRLPVSWADGTKGWSGYLAPQEVPVVYNPEHQRIWTANSRVVGGEALASSALARMPTDPVPARSGTGCLPRSILTSGICWRSSSTTAGCCWSGGRP